MNPTNNLIEIASRYEPITRINGNGSKPRFTADANRVFHSTLRWLKRMETEEPPYQVDSRARDKWLQQFWRKESFMAGVVNSVVLIDANRGWTLTGGRNQVRKWTARLHDSAGGMGWRYLIKKGSLSFWTTDLNAIFGVRREEPWASLTTEGIIKGPMLSLENVDPAKCHLYPSRAKAIELGGAEVESDLMYSDNALMPWDYFRVASMPSDQEEYRGLGFCALSRCLNLAKLLYAVYEYDQEKFLAKAPRGLLLLHNITESQWNTAMEAREARMSAKEREYYGSVEVLASDGGEYNPDAKLVALSQLPDGFDQQTMTHLLIAGYSVCFGRDFREFLPASEGNLGTGRETAEQANKANSKGGADFSLSFQERIQDEIPPTVHFEFEERDEQGELLEAEVRMAKAEVIEKLSQLREQSGAVLTNEQIMQLLAQENLIPQEWTEAEEDVTSTDEEQVRQRLLDSPKIRSACERYPNEPIVRYIWGERPKEVILWGSGFEALKRRVWPVVFEGEQLRLTGEEVKPGLITVDVDSFMKA